MAPLTLTRSSFEAAPPVSSFIDRTVFQTRAWLAFIAATQQAEPVIATVLDGDLPIGRFTGAILRKNGMRILGSPFPGWTTSYMGFNLPSGVRRAEALVALKRFAFKVLGCMHLEVLDRLVTPDDLDAAGYRYDARPLTGFEIDLTQDEDALLKGMDAGRRRYIRRAESSGLRIEVADDAAFANEYYAQLDDVFARQRLVPTYSLDRVRSLITHVHPSGDLLLLRARNAQGVCIATGIFPALNDTMVFWGGASWKRWHHLHPNEPLQWFAMRYWKARGITRYDMGGTGEYKRAYGGREIRVPWGRASRYAAIEHLRNGARTLVSLTQRLRGTQRN